MIYFEYDKVMKLISDINTLDINTYTKCMYFFSKNIYDKKISFF